MRPKYKLLVIVGLFIAVTQTIAPATALPGQSIKSFLRWAKSRPVSTQNNPMRTDSTKLYHMNAAPSSGKVSKANLPSNKDTTVRFSRYNEKALKLILKFYGSHSAKNHPNR